MGGFDLIPSRCFLLFRLRRFFSPAEGATAHATAMGGSADDIPFDTARLVSSSTSDFTSDAFFLLFLSDSNRSTPLYGATRLLKFSTFSVDFPDRVPDERFLSSSIPPVIVIAGLASFPLDDELELLLSGSTAALSRGPLL